MIQSISLQFSIQPALHQPQQQQQRRDRDRRESLGQTGRLVPSHVGKDFKREPEVGSAPGQHQHHYLHF